MPLFNPRHDHLQDCINSLIEQKFKDFELIVVDDSFKNVDNNKLFKFFLMKGFNILEMRILLVFKHL